MQYIFQDWNANKRNPKARTVLAFFRIAQLIRRNRLLFWPGIPILIAYRVLVEWLLGVEIPWNTEIGEGFIFYHGQGLVINDHTTIGKHCIVRNNSTIGRKSLPGGALSDPPTIGDNVEFGANVVVIGPITIGDNAIIGAGSVVVKDIPANGVAVGNPARIIRIQGDPGAADEADANAVSAGSAS